MTDCVPRPDDPLLLRRAEAAALLAVAEKTVQRLTDSGRLPVVRLGRCVRYRREQLEQLIESSTEVGETLSRPRQPVVGRGLSGFDRLPKLEERARAKQRARTKGAPTVAATQEEKR